MGYDLESIERYLRRRLRERDRRRYDRAKRFVEEAGRRSGDRAAAHRLRARWYWFLCKRRPVQTDIWSADIEFLRQFASFIGVPPAEMREFVVLSLLGQLWRAHAFIDLMEGPPEVVGRLTRVAGWEHFQRCRADGSGVILLPTHSQFSRLFMPYLRYRGHDGLKVGIPRDFLVVDGHRTPAAQRLELARQMHAAKHELARGGIVFNVPDALQHLDNSRPVEFFGRERRIAVGFAELAIRSGARVVPLACRFSPRGFFLQEFGAPFHDPGPQATPGERIDALVGQYAGFLRDQWRRYPWNIQWKQLKHFCQWPAIEAGEAPQQAPAISPRAQAALPQ